MTYAVNGKTRIYYEVVDGDGPTLVLHHGLSASGTSWHEFGYVEPLRQDYRLVLIDARGHGRSDKPHDPESYTAPQLTGDVLAVLDAVDVERAHYFGFSLGARIGFDLAGRAPDRLRSCILGALHPYAVDVEPFRQIFAQGLEAWLQYLEQDAGPLPFMFVERILQNDIEALRALVAKDLPDNSDVLPTMTMPCRLYVGDADPFRPLVERCARELPDASCLILEDTTHNQSLVRGDKVLPLILEDVQSFLAAADASRYGAARR